MISNLYSSSPLLYVSTGGSNPYINMSNPSAGMVRYDGNTSCLQVYDGSSWLPLSATTNLQIAPQLESVVAWAQRRMAEEEEEARLRKEHPLLQDAYDQYKVTVELVKKHNIGEAL